MSARSKFVRMGDRRVSIDKLTETFWQFGTAVGVVYATQMRLLPDGRVGGYVDRNECRWEACDGAILLKNDVGVTTSCLDTANEVDGRLVLEGPFLGAQQVRHRLVAVPPFALLPTLEQATLLRPATDRGKRRNLVVIRANDKSLHTKWPRDIPPEDRNWDLALSWYGNPDGHPDDPDASYHCVQHGEGKWTALWKLLYPDSPVWSYDFVMFPDDDLAWSFSGVNIAFERARDFNLMLAQPSLADEGYVIHDITRNRPGNILRFTNFVEVMAPIFSNAALRLCGATFSESKYGFGLDHIWPKLIGEPRSRIGIIDQTSIVHTRPQGQSYGLAPAIEEGQAISAKYRARETYDVYGAIQRDPL